MANHPQLLPLNGTKKTHVSKRSKGPCIKITVPSHFEIRPEHNIVLRRRSKRKGSQLVIYTEWATTDRISSLPGSSTSTTTTTTSTAPAARESHAPTTSSNNNPTTNRSQPLPLWQTVKSEVRCQPDFLNGFNKATWKYPVEVTVEQLPANCKPYPYLWAVSEPALKEELEAHPELVDEKVDAFWEQWKDQNPVRCYFAARTSFTPDGRPMAVYLNYTKNQVGGGKLAVLCLTPTQKHRITCTYFYEGADFPDQSISSATLFYKKYAEKVGLPPSEYQPNKDGKSKRLSGYVLCIFRVFFIDTTCYGTQEDPKYFHMGLNFVRSNLLAQKKNLAKTSEPAPDVSLEAPAEAGYYSSSGSGSDNEANVNAAGEPSTDFVASSSPMVGDIAVASDAGGGDTSDNQESSDDGEDESFDDD